MTIKKIVENDKITLKFEGWLDVETTANLTALMSELEESKELVFDFKKLEYISSSGVREVVAAYRRQKELQGEFSLINVNAEVMDVFSMTGLDKKLDIKAE